MVVPAPVSGSLLQTSRSSGTCFHSSSITTSLANSDVSFNHSWTLSFWKVYSDVAGIKDGSANMQFLYKNYLTITKISNRTGTEPKTAAAKREEM